MSFVEDIVATWRRPRAVFARRFAQGQREDTAILVLMVGAALSFVSQIPAMARLAHLQERDLDTDLAAAAVGTLLTLPLVFYALAALISLIARALRQDIGFFGGRMAFFWAYLAASPLMLLYGLGRGFAPDSPALILVGLAWMTGFFVFLFAGIKEARQWWQGGVHAAQ